MSDMKKGSSEDFGKLKLNKIENLKSEEFLVNNKSDINEKSSQNIKRTEVASGNYDERRMTLLNFRLQHKYFFIYFVLSLFLLFGCAELDGIFPKIRHQNDFETKKSSLLNSFLLTI